MFAVLQYSWGLHCFAKRGFGSTMCAVVDRASGRFGESDAMRIESVTHNTLTAKACRRYVLD